VVITWGDRLKPPHKSTPVKLQIRLPANASPPYMAGHTRTTHTQTTVSRYYDFIIEIRTSKMRSAKFACFQHQGQEICGRIISVFNMEIRTSKTKIWKYDVRFFNIKIRTSKTSDP
jgi:hypothetical protein